jgi:hypothetical protein
MGSTITAPQTVPQHVVDVEIINRRHRPVSSQSLAKRGLYVGWDVALLVEQPTPVGLLVAV